MIGLCTILSCMGFVSIYFMNSKQVDPIILLSSMVSSITIILLHITLSINNQILKLIIFFIGESMLISMLILLLEDFGKNQKLTPWWQPSNFISNTNKKISHILKMMGFAYGFIVLMNINFVHKCITNDKSEFIVDLLLFSMKIGLEKNPKFSIFFNFEFRSVTEIKKIIKDTYMFIINSETFDDITLIGKRYCEMMLMPFSFFKGILQCYKWLNPNGNLKIFLEQIGTGILVIQILLIFSLECVFDLKTYLIMVSISSFICIMFSYYRENAHEIDQKID
jgi:hypothetical protein